MVREVVSLSILFCDDGADFEVPAETGKGEWGQSGLAPFSRTVRKDNLVQFGFKVDRALVVKTGVKSGAVIEGLDVIEGGGAGLGTGSEAMMVDQFVFETAK